MLADVLQLTHDVVGKVTDCTRGERRQSGHDGGTLFAQQIFDDLKDIPFALLVPLPPPEENVLASSLHLHIGARPQEGVAADLLATFHGLEQEGVRLVRRDGQERRNRCQQVRGDRLDHGH